MQQYRIPDMSCAHCVATVTQAIRSVDPRAQVEVSLASGTVRVETEAAAQAVQDSLRSAGYENQLVAA